MDSDNPGDTSLREAALKYHEFPRPGKIEISLTKPAETAYDLALAYSPGVGEPVLEIAKDPAAAYRYTGKGNLVAVISNGTAILGLGDRGALASKPVMEGKALLFKRFAGIDVFDIEIDTRDVDELVETIARIAPTFGGINLEDIAAPACFEVERRLSEMLDIPVFHDDQHGTAIVQAAGLLNALELQGKRIETAKVVCLGAGAAAIAGSDLLIQLGMPRENLVMLDSKGVIHTGREDLNEYKQKFAIDTNARTLDDACLDADVFIGLSGANLMSRENLASMASKPIVFAMANPNPEIDPRIVSSIRKDAILATGRSDYPNQVNNVLCFPFIFRGALDAKARQINLPMKLACVKALRDLAREPVPEEVLRAYNMGHMEFSSEYILPKPVDPRLLDAVAPKVTAAAVASGVSFKDW